MTLDHAKGDCKGWDYSMAHCLAGHEFTQALGSWWRTGGLACCSPWGRRVGHDWAPGPSWTVWLQEPILSSLPSPELSNIHGSSSPLEENNPSELSTDFPVVSRSGRYSRNMGRKEEGGKEWRNKSDYKQKIIIENRNCNDIRMYRRLQTHQLREEMSALIPNMNFINSEK